MEKPVAQVRNVDTLKKLDQLKAELQIKTRTGVIDYLVEHFPFYKGPQGMAENTKKSDGDLEEENRRLRQQLQALLTALQEKKRIDAHISELLQHIGDDKI